MVKPVVGILGGGQLAMMLAEAAEDLGLSCVALDPDPACPASHACPIEIGAYDDAAALDRLAHRCNVVTFEFENVPAASAERLAKRVAVRPGPEALRIAQDRLFERRLFAELGIDAPEMRPVDSLADLIDAAEAMGGPAILKARRQGYDGKGQSVLHGPEDAERAWIAVGRVPAILDRMVPFTREVSVIATRGVDGGTVVYPICENQHANGILCVTRAPADAGGPVAALAQAAATRILDRLGYVGTLAVEFFQVGDGPDARLLANEIAPRVHNTGHWTIEGAAVSQFENHLRAILGLPLGSTEPIGHAAMVNLIGEIPDSAAVLSVPGASLHLYGKRPRPGRKVGHVTFRADSADRVARGVAALRGLPGVGPLPAEYGA